MAATHTAPPTAATQTTEDGFLADRVAFWDRFTGFTLKTTVALVWFCAWLWWCTFAGFGFLHALSLPVIAALIFVLL